MCALPSRGTDNFFVSVRSFVRFRCLPAFVSFSTGGAYTPSPLLPGSMGGMDGTGGVGLYHGATSSNSLAEPSALLLAPARRLLRILLDLLDSVY